MWITILIIYFSLKTHLHLHHQAKIIFAQIRSYHQETPTSSQITWSNSTDCANNHHHTAAQNRNINIRHHHLPTTSSPLITTSILQSLHFNPNIYHTNYNTSQTLHCTRSQLWAVHQHQAHITAQLPLLTPLYNSFVLNFRHWACVIIQLQPLTAHDNSCGLYITNTTPHSTLLQIWALHHQAHATTQLLYHSLLHINPAHQNIS